MIFPSPTVSPARGVCLSLIASLLFLLNFVWIFLHSLGCRSIFPPSLQFVFMRVASHVNVFLMYLWKKVSSTSSYSIVFISPILYFSCHFILNYLLLLKCFFVCKSFTSFLPVQPFGFPQKESIFSFTPFFTQYQFSISISIFFF